MFTRLRWLSIFAAMSAAAGCHAGPPALSAPSPLVLERTIALKGVSGRIDHLAIDLKHGRLFVSELGAGTVEAIDLAKGVRRGRISGLAEPQGLAYVTDRDMLVVASGGDGSVRFYAATGFTPLGAVMLGQDADDVRLDPRSGAVVVGYGSGGLAMIDPASRAITGRLILPGHPEGFALKGDRVFVNVPDARRIAGGDMSGHGASTNWATTHAWNFPMAFDAASNTLAVVYRLPGRLVAINAASGAVKADKSTCADADDAYFDPPRHRLYVICGSGVIDVMQTKNYEAIARIATRMGARTGLFSPELDRLFVAARSGLGKDAAILIYRPQP